MLPKKVLIPKSNFKQRDDVIRSKVYDYISHEPLKENSPKHKISIQLNTFDHQDAGRLLLTDKKPSIQTLLETQNNGKPNAFH